MYTTNKKLVVSKKKIIIIISLKIKKLSDKCDKSDKCPHILFVNLKAQGYEFSAIACMNVLFQVAS